MQQRRLSRLYGSNAKNIRRGSSQKKNAKVKDEEPPKDNTNSARTVEKFIDRTRNEQAVEIHADNYNITQPWFVGYQNAGGLSGSPQALVSR